MSSQRFFASTASWNQPVAALGRAVGYDDYPLRLQRWGYGTDVSARGKLWIKLADYSVPIYDRAKATTTARCYQVPWSQSQQTFGNVPIGVTIPWNPAWRGGSGQDGCVVIVDYRTGEAWYLWGLVGANCFDWFGPNNRAGYSMPGGVKLCVATVHRQADIWAATDAARPGGLTATGPWQPTVSARGMGIDKAALVVRAAEVAAGAIGHALPLTVANPMFGPLASPPVGNTGVGAGISTGFWCRPATKLEWVSRNPFGVSSDETRSRSVPSGMRFALDISDNAIDVWLNARGYVGPKRQTARVFAVAMRDYGMIVAESGAWGIGIECDGVYNPESAAIWKALGLDTTVSTALSFNNPSGDLLEGLWERGSLYVVAQPA